MEDIEVFRSLTKEIIASVKTVHPKGLEPLVGDFDTDPIDPVCPLNIRYEASFPLNFSDGTEWVISFPLPSRNAPGFVGRRVTCEVATLGWVKQFTKLPVPLVHHFDATGTAEWNKTRRPCLILDKMPGKHIKNQDWIGMTTEQKLRVVEQIARITAELMIHSFHRIGSLDKDEKKRCYVVGPLLSQAVNRAPKSPYPSAMEFLIDLANMRLVHEAISSEEISDAFLDFWIYRSLLPSLILDDFDRGPFFLTHMALDRHAVLFDDEFRLTGVTNWEFACTQPLQKVACLPDFLSGIPIDFEADNELWGLIRTCYTRALKGWGREFAGRKSGPSFHQVLSELSTGDVRLVHLATDVSNSADFPKDLWKYLFHPILGEIDKVAFMEMYRKAPGVVDEFRRIRTGLQIQDRMKTSEVAANSNPQVNNG